MCITNRPVKLCSSLHHVINVYERFLIKHVFLCFLLIFLTFFLFLETLNGQCENNCYTFDKRLLHITLS